MVFLTLQESGAISAVSSTQIIFPLLGSSTVGTSAELWKLPTRCSPAAALPTEGLFALFLPRALPCSGAHPQCLGSVQCPPGLPPRSLPPSSAAGTQTPALCPVHIPSGMSHSGHALGSHSRAGAGDHALGGVCRVSCSTAYPLALDLAWDSSWAGLLTGPQESEGPQQCWGTCPCPALET